MSGSQCHHRDNSLRVPECEPLISDPGARGGQLEEVEALETTRQSNQVTKSLTDEMRRAKCTYRCPSSPAVPISEISRGQGCSDRNLWTLRQTRQPNFGENMKSAGSQYLVNNCFSSVKKWL